MLTNSLFSYFLTRVINIILLLTIGTVQTNPRKVFQTSKYHNINITYDNDENGKYQHQYYLPTYSGSIKKKDGQQFQFTLPNQMNFNQQKLSNQRNVNADIQGSHLETSHQTSTYGNGQYGPPKPDTEKHPHYNHHHNHEHEPYGYGVHEHHREPEMKKKTFEKKAIKIVSKTIAGSKAIKFGSVFVIAQLFIVVVALGLLTTSGARLSPIAFPLALFPIGLLASIPAIPLFIAAFSAVVIKDKIGLNSRKRKRRSIKGVQFNPQYPNPMNQAQNDLLEMLTRIPEYLNYKELRLQLEEHGMVK